MEPIFTGVTGEILPQVFKKGVAHASMGDTGTRARDN